ncbi:MAG: heavy-metal-associated domain-containing protein [Flavobacteriaceae bacterium]|nr:heavy-metal-associated domain-containing protein [Bacteroidia bacterium]NNL15947.1 heavy-metal-associated domain-containing protein [Flavobacteriaceae bacterium]
MKTTLEIQNLKCNGCASTITNRLSELDSIKKVTVDVDKNAVTFEFDADDTLELVKKELHKLGYPLVGEDNKFPTKAKSYVSCAIGRMNS